MCYTCIQRQERQQQRWLILLELRVKPTAFNEDAGQPFRFADHNHVTGVDLDERLHTTERLNILVLHLRSEDTIPPSQNPGSRDLIRHSSPRRLLREDAK